MSDQLKPCEREAFESWWKGSDTKSYKSAMRAAWMERANRDGKIIDEDWEKDFCNILHTQDIQNTHINIEQAQEILGRLKLAGLIPAANTRPTPNVAGDVVEHLRYLENRFRNEVHICTSCGEEDSTDGCDSHEYVKAALSTTPQGKALPSEDEAVERPYPELLSDDEKKLLLEKAEALWLALQSNELGGFSGINRPFLIEHEFREVIEAYGKRDVGLTWSYNALKAAEQSSAPQPQPVTREDLANVFYEAMASRPTGASEYDIADDFLSQFNMTRK